MTQRDFLLAYAVESSTPEEAECNLRKEVIVAITTENNEDVASLRAMLGTSDNDSSLTNFVDAGTFVPLTNEELMLPEEIPLKPMGCDDAAEASVYSSS